MSKIRFDALAVTMLLALALPVHADQKPAEKQPTEEKTGGKAGETTPAKTYTNDDLERMFPKTEPEPTPDSAPAKEGAEPPPAGPDAEPADALRWLDERKAADRASRQSVTDARAAVAQAEERVRALEERLRALRDPLLKRPEAPEDDTDWGSLSTPERVAQTEAELEGARTELSQARRELDRVRSAGRTPPA